MAWFGTASLLLVLGLIPGNDDGWDSRPILAALIGSAGLFVAFGLAERRVPAPMLPLTIAALVAIAGAVIAWPLLGDQRSAAPAQDSPTGRAPGERRAHPARLTKTSTASIPLSHGSQRLERSPTPGTNRPTRDAYRV